MKIADDILLTNQNATRRLRFWPIIFAPVFTRLILGSVLLFAAGIKVHDFLTAMPAKAANSSLFANAQPEIIIIETILGVWLITGWRWSVSRLVASAWMLALCGVSLYKALAGEASCGCFGQFHVNPWLIFSFDVSALAALAATPGRVSKIQSNLRQIAIAGSQFVMLGILILGLINSLHQSPAPTPAVVQAQSTNWRQAVMWPLAKYVDVWDDISHGEWVVLVYNSRCRPCTSTRDEYELLAKQWKSQNSPVQIAMLDIAGKEADPAEGTDPGLVALYGQLNLPQNSNLDIASPALVLLNEGKVVQLSEGYEDSQWNERVFPQ